MLTNTIIDSEVQSGITKTDKSDHFAVFTLMKSSLVQPNIKETFMKRDINEDSTKYFKSILNSVDWNLIAQTSTPDRSYNIFLGKFVKLYDIAFQVLSTFFRSLDYTSLEKTFKEKAASIWKVFKT